MTLYRSLTLLGAAAAVATSAHAQQAKSCDIDESKPKEVATANFMIQQARGLQPLQKKLDALKKVVKVLTEKFGLGNMDLTLVVRSPSGVLEPAAAEAGRRLVDEVRNAPYISGVVSPWDDESARREGLISEDGKTALVIARVSGGENNAPKYAKDVADRVSGEHDGLTVLAGGSAMVASEINEQSEKDLLSAELIALPLSLIVLVWVFGGLFAALLPLVVGVMAIIGTLGMIRGITLFADVSIFAPVWSMPLTRSVSRGSAGSGRMM